MAICANITLGKKPYSIAINEETNRVYVGVDNGLMVIHGDTNQIIADIPMSDDVIALAVNPSTNRIYAGVYSDNVTVIDGATNLKIGEIPEQLYSPYELTTNPSTNRVYAADWSTIVGVADYVRVYSGETFQSVASVALGVSPNIERIGLAVNPTTNKVYAAWTRNNSLFMIDGSTNLITKSVIPSSFDRSIVVNSYTGYVYSGSTVLNGATLEQITSGLTSEVVAVDPIHNLLYSIYSYDTLHRLNGTTHAITDSLELQWTFYSSSDQAAVNSKTSKVYLAHNFGSSPIEVIPEFSAAAPVLTAFVVLAAAASASKRGMLRKR